VAAEDLGDLQAEILQAKHAIHSDTPRPVHGGCEAAANRGKEVPGERQRPTNPHAHTHTGTQYRPRVGVATSRLAQVLHTAISRLGTKVCLSTRTWTRRSSNRFRARRDGSGRASGEGRVPRPGRRPLRPSKIAILDQGTSRGPDTGKVECDNRELKKIKKAPQDAQRNPDSRVPHEDAKRQNQEP